MPSNVHPRESVTAIQQQVPNFIPKVAVVLGSGLGKLAEAITDATAIPYADIPGFPVSSVAGHAGELVFGMIGNTPVACLKGRIHAYEGDNHRQMKTMIRSLKLLGCEDIIITNSSGSLRQDVGPGELMMINDHINFQPFNPLVGINDEEFGPRFFPMDDAYNKELQQGLLATAQRLDIRLATGVYISVLGPNFETPAEIRAFRTLGADAVGMSTVPEVLIARHCDLKVAVIASITNFACGLSNEQLTHEGTLHYASIAADNLIKLLTSYIGTRS